MIPYCPGGPMSCQSAPVHAPPLLPGPGRTDHLGTQGPGVSRGPHKMPLVPFIGFFGLGKDTGAP
ncbi:unnamed protein product [Staurois parvus]|uniref:Uncharacterized protein n=1 Tax=Staurois parvus TaxID=386267 RepID=A0ABN9GXW7_9NEOB|nr:unnamed protein product [Staurois parvus]